MGKKQQDLKILQSSKLRNSGLSIVGKVAWGTHFCQFYKTQGDLFDILIPYFKTGLEDNEFCVWVTSEFLTKEEAIEKLKKTIPAFPKYLKKGQIEIIPYTDWYLKTGKFELDRVLKMWIAKHNQGLKMGFAGLRVSGNPFWIDNKKDWDDFANYEAEINKVIDPFKLLVLCTYSLDKCGANEVIDVVSNHKFALVKRRGKWNLIESAEQKKIREALAESENRYQALTLSLPDTVITASNKGEIIALNESAVNLFGYAKKELIGKPLTTLMPKRYRESHIKGINRLGSGGKPKIIGKIVELHGVKKDGTEFPIELSLASWSKGKEKLYTGIIRDITERKRAEKEISESEEKYRSLFTNMTNGFAYCRMIYDKNGNPKDFEYLEVNEVFEKLTGLKKESVLGKRVTAAIPGIKKANPEIFNIYGRVALTQGEESFEAFISPIEKWLSISVYSPKKGYFVAVFDDITERKTSEEKRRNFITIVGHELRNIITPIGLSAYVLERKVQDQDLKKAIKLIKNQTGSMAGLVNDLIDLSRIERGSIELRKEKINVVKAVKRAIENVRPLIEASEQKLKVSLPKKKTVALVDSLRIEQILINLLTNASKYSAKKSLISLSLKQKDSQIAISVKDQGIGIPKRSLSTVFNLFSRAKNGKKGEKKEGVGIGLYISRELARLHSGEISVTSQGKGKGSEFILRIPME